MYSDGFTGWIGEQFGFDSQQGQENFLFTVSRPDLGSTHPPILWVLGTFSQEVKWQRNEFDPSPSSIAEDKNGVAIRPLPIRLHGVLLN
jgi:hypothetical protein